MRRSPHFSIDRPGFDQTECCSVSGGQCGLGYGFDLCVKIDSIGDRNTTAAPLPVLTYIEYAPLRCYGAVTVPWRLSMITGELRKSIVGGPPNLASTIALHSPP